MNFFFKVICKRFKFLNYFSSTCNGIIIKYFGFNAYFQFLDEEGKNVKQFI